MKVSTSLAAVSIGLFSIPASAVPLVIECPARIAVEETVKASYPSWEATPDKGKGDLHLQAILLYDGHPREMASLVPDKTTEMAGRLVATWELPKTETGRSYWVGCAYRNSMTMLTKRLPATLSSCRYTQKRLASGTLAGVESFTCE
jgi:hypothetical protein